ncbi:MAG TPA: hypothetical protein PKA10_01525 [Selenomonadales bacterium]|nr:hypothetical protein [Selenomonadales bacterium]
MNYRLSIPEAYQNLNKVLDFLLQHKAEGYLIDSVQVARNTLLVVEMMGIISSSQQAPPPASKS